MLCDFNTFLHIIYAYMVTYTLFVYLFNPNTKYRDIYRIPQISQKITRYEFLLISPSPSINKFPYYSPLCDGCNCVSEYCASGLKWEAPLAGSGRWTSLNTYLSWLMHLVRTGVVVLCVCVCVCVLVQVLPVRPAAAGSAQKSAGVSAVCQGWPSSPDMTSPLAAVSSFPRSGPAPTKHKHNDDSSYFSQLWMGFKKRVVMAVCVLVYLLTVGEELV